MRNERINLKLIPFEHIVTRNMVRNIEADVNSMIAEDAFIEQLHISDQLAVKHKVRNYNKDRSNGFTILIKEEKGQYSYQVAVCNTKDNFDRLKGRYFANLRAKRDGFIDVPSEAISYAGEDHFKKQLAVVNFFIQHVHNYVEPVMVNLKDVVNPIPLKDFTKAFVQSLEEIVLGAAGKGVKVQYFTDKRDGVVGAYLVKSKDSNSDISSENRYEEYKDFRGKAPLTKEGKVNKWYDRYNALYELLTVITNTSEA